MFVTLYEIGEVHFCLFGTSGFYVKAENEKLSLRACVVVRTSSSGRLATSEIARKNVPHVQHDYFSSFNQSNNRFCGVVVVVADVIS